MKPLHYSELHWLSNFRAECWAYQPSLQKLRILNPKPCTLNLKWRQRRLALSAAKPSV